MPRVLFTAAAKADLDDAVTWYADHAPNVVPQFLEALQVVVERIEENPRQFPYSSHRTRRALLRRFPYLVIFSERPEAIYVVAVFHTSRDPRIWQQRTK